MSKKKKFTDVINTSPSSINLKGGDIEDDSKRLTKNENVFYKHESVIREVKDLDGQKKSHFLYVKGKLFKQPKYLNNLLKIAGIGFLIVLFINIFSVYSESQKLEEEISKQAFEGYSLLINAGKDAAKIDFSNAREIFENAKTNFTQASDKLWFINTDNTFYSKKSYLGQAVSALIEGGEHFALAGEYFIDALDNFNKIPLYFVAKNKSQNLPNPSITDALKYGLEKTNLAIEEINLASDKISVINEEVLPVDLRTRFIFAKESLKETSEFLNKTSKHFPAILKLLGDRYPHRFLVLLQNNNEIRPSGGFIGSYAIVDINDGYIEKLEVHDSYDLDGAYGMIIEPPEDLKSFISNWRFRDSNYSYDFELSAQKARWFLQKEGGPGVDTVIGINQGLLQPLLEISGPIQVGNFGKLDSENYNLLLSYVIESKAWGADDPKHILKVFIPAFKEAILKEENLGKILSKLYKAIQQKHIMMYSSDGEIQEFFEAFGLSGKATKQLPDEDYLSVINFSVGGTKSDQFIEENISHDTQIDEKGELIDVVTIKRTHFWTDEIYYNWKKILNKYGFNELSDQVIDILGRGKNQVITKVYVPQGSVLIESNGKDIQTLEDTELNKTYFLFKQETSTGQTSSIVIKYKLPFILNFEPLATYKFIVEKQPGSRGSILNKTLHVTEDLETKSVYPTETQLSEENTVAVYATNLTYDRYFSAIIED